MHRGSATKNHHYVPSSYLGRFADAEGFLNVWDRPRSQLRRQRPAEVMKIRYYYRQPWAPQGIDPNIMETALGQDLEGKARNVIDRLIDQPACLDDNDTATLLVYLEFQRIRVPRQAATAKQLMMKESARFDYMRWMNGNLHPWFARMEWEVIEAEKGAVFITTDSPVSLYNPECPPPAEAGIALAGTKVLFPLSSRTLLLMRHPECRSEHPLKVLVDPMLGDGVISITHGAVWDQKVVTSTNWKLLRLAHHFVVGESKEVLEQCGARSQY